MARSFAVPYNMKTDFALRVTSDLAGRNVYEWECLHCHVRIAPHEQAAFEHYDGHFRAAAFIERVSSRFPWPKSAPPEWSWPDKLFEDAVERRLALLKKKVLRNDY